MNKMGVFKAAYKLQRYCSTVYSIQNSPKAKYFLNNNHHIWKKTFFHGFPCYLDFKKAYGTIERAVIWRERNNFETPEELVRPAKMHIVHRNTL